MDLPLDLNPANFREVEEENTVYLLSVSPLQPQLESEIFGGAVQSMIKKKKSGTNIYNNYIKYIWTAISCRCFWVKIPQPRPVRMHRVTVRSYITI